MRDTCLLGLKRFIEIRYEADSLVVDTMTIHLPCWFGCCSMLVSFFHSRQAHGWFQLNSPWKTEKEVKLLVSDAFTYTILHTLARYGENAGTKEKAFLWRPAKPSDHRTTKSTVHHTHNPVRLCVSSTLVD